MLKTGVQEDRILKCHTGRDGDVWYVDGNSDPRSSKMAESEFADAISDQSVRVVATQDNAELIVCLYRRQLADRSVSVELCCPASVAWREMAERGPADVLHCMRQVGGDPISRGGWHKLTHKDYPSYALAAHFRRGGEEDATAAEHLAAHPAFPALSFIPQVDGGKLARTVAAILDPRWFVHTDNPDTLSRLRYYFDVINSKPTPKGNRATRRGYLVGAWKTADAPPRHIEIPGNFAWRRWSEEAKNGTTAADTAASRTFLAYLAGVWLDALMMKSSPRQAMFAPECFFRSDYEAKAWSAHMHVGKR